MIFSRDEFIYLLTKSAAETNDRINEAVSDMNDTRSQSGSTLKELFSQASNVEKGQSSTMKKLLPGSKSKETSNPLMKLGSFSRELLSLFNA